MLRSVVRFTIASCLFAGLFLASASLAQEKPDIRHQIADAYGLSSWSQVEQIRYTFNVDAGVKKVARTWTWEIKPDRVTYEGPDSTGKPVKTTYTRGAMAPDVVKDVDPNFINDQYWLLFPFHVVWDSSPNVEDAGTHKLPLGKGSAERVVVKYPAEAGGYTPGDTWELYVGKDNRVEEFIYRRGGDKKPSVVIATWAGYKKAGPLLISTEHRGTADGKPLHLFFSNVAVKLTGSDTWVNAQ